MRIALAQLVSSSSPASNLERIRQYAAEAKQAGAELVIFPEAAMCAFGNDLSAVAEPLDGEWASAVRAAAAELEIAIVAGMFTPGGNGKVRNTLLATGRGVDTSYDKIHLFDAFGFQESDSVDGGDELGIFNLGGLTFGLSTCYDVRFPALFAANARAGADVNIVCASWGAGPGKTEQWDLLVRARALDATTFVLACGQGDPATPGRGKGGPATPALGTAGTAPTGVGHSAAVSPFGEVLDRLGGEPGLLVCDLDPALVAEARAKLPVLANAHAFQAGA